MKRETSSLILFALLAITTFKTANAVNYTQYAELRKASASGEGAEKLVVKENIPDLSKSTFADYDDACLNGVWILYENRNYNPDGKGDMNRYFSTNGDVCPSLEGVSSMRYAGVQTDYRTSSFTFYEHHRFAGRVQIALTESAKDINASGGSIIITGNDCWTLYASKDYEGAITCLAPPGAGFGFEPTFADSLDIYNISPIDKIRSKGCPCEI